MRVNHKSRDRPNTIQPNWLHLLPISSLAATHCVRMDIAGSQTTWEKIVSSSRLWLAGSRIPDRKGHQEISPRPHSFDAAPHSFCTARIFSTHTVTLFFAFLPPVEFSTSKLFFQLLIRNLPQALWFVLVLTYCRLRRAVVRFASSAPIPCSSNSVPFHKPPTSDLAFLVSSTLVRPRFFSNVKCREHVRVFFSEDILVLPTKKGIHNKFTGILR